MGFLSASGCCARCRRIVSCRASSRDEAVGSLPYRHKVRRGDRDWCDGHRYPALHFTESADKEMIQAIFLVERQHRAMMGRRRRERR